MGALGKKLHSPCSILLCGTVIHVFFWTLNHTLETKSSKLTALNMCNLLMTDCGDKFKPNFNKNAFKERKFTIMDDRLSFPPWWPPHHHENRTVQNLQRNIEMLSSFYFWLLKLHQCLFENFCIGHWNILVIKDVQGSFHIKWSLHEKPSMWVCFISILVEPHMCGNFMISKT